MKKRLQSVQRILSVQQKMQQLAEWKMAEIQREQNQVQRAQQDMLTYLGCDLQMRQLAAPAQRMLRHLIRESAALEAAKAEQAEILLEHGKKVKQVERVAQDLAVEVRRTGERKELAELVEQALANPAASLR
jgi:hypothetical protein